MIHYNNWEITINFTSRNKIMDLNFDISNFTKYVGVFCGLYKNHWKKMCEWETFFGRYKIRLEFGKDMPFGPIIRRKMKMSIIFPDIFRKNFADSINKLTIICETRQFQRFCLASEIVCELNLSIQIGKFRTLIEANKAYAWWYFVNTNELK